VHRNKGKKRIMNHQFPSLSLRIAVAAFLILDLHVAATADEVSPAESHALDLARTKRLPIDEQNKLTEIETAVRNEPTKAPAIVTSAISTSVSMPITFSGAAVGAAITGLGSSIDRVSISRLINAAGKARPEAILEIVRVAMHDTPKRLHRDIVSAAVLAVPDAYRRVRVTRVEMSGIETSEGYSGNGSGIPGRRQMVDRRDFGKSIADGKQLEGKQVEGKEPEGKGGPNEELGNEPMGYEPAQDSFGPTLAESILSVAVNSWGDTFGELAGALNDSLITLVSGPDGTNTRGNPPFTTIDPPPATPTPTVPAPTPTPPPVSP
jgi:hypothetical protein